MNTKVFTIIVLILSLALLALLGGWLFITYGGWSPLSPSGEPANTASSSAPAATFFPADPAPVTPPTEPATATEPEPGVIADNSLLARLTERPIAGLFAMGTGTSSAIWFADRGSGQLYQLDPGNSPARLTQTTIPQIARIVGGSTASSTFVLYRANTQDGRWFRGRLSELVAPVASSSVFSSVNLETGNTREVTSNPESSLLFDLAVNPNRDSLAILTQEGELTRVIRTDWSGGNRQNLLSLPLTELAITWPASSTLALQTRAAAEAPGYLYFYNLTSRVLEPIVTNVRGLASLASPTGRYVAYSGATGQTSFFSGLFDRETRAISRLPFSTIIDKCVWSAAEILYCGVPTAPSAASYPDDWYAGQVSFNDTFWRFDPNSRDARLLFDSNLENKGQIVDAAQLVLDGGEANLYFLNKSDLNLWRLALTAGF
jgi:hypothetical protein